MECFDCERVGRVQELVGPGYQTYLCYSDIENAKPCRVINTEEGKLTRECVFSEHKNVQHAGGRREKNHWLW